MPAKIVSTDRFCALVEHAVAVGDGIVPLLGAGLSAGAGIPTRPDLMLYLQWCVAKALGLDGEESPNGRRWHPQLSAWPEMRGDWHKNADRGARRLNDVVNLQP